MYRNAITKVPASMWLWFWGVSGFQVQSSLGLQRPSAEFCSAVKAADIESGLLKRLKKRPFLSFSMQNCSLVLLQTLSELFVPRVVG